MWFARVKNDSRSLCFLLVLSKEFAFVVVSFQMQPTNISITGKNMEKNARSQKRKDDVRRLPFWVVELLQIYEEAEKSRKADKSCVKENP